MLLLDPLGAMIAGGQALGNAFSTMATNHTNKKIARETNEMAYKMFTEANSFNREMALDMFNLENAYNDPRAVRERLEAAGYNPFVMADGGSQFANGNVSTPQSSGLPTLVTPNMQAPQINFASDIGDLTLKSAQAKKLGADTKTVDQMRDKLVLSQELDNRIKAIDERNKSLFDEELRHYQNENERVKVFQAWENLKLTEQNLKNAIADGDIKAIQKERESLQKQMDDERLKWLPKELMQEYNNLIELGKTYRSQQYQNYTQGKANMANANYTRAQQQTVDELRPHLVKAQKTGNLNASIDVLVKLCKTPYEIQELKSRIRNLDADSRKKFAEEVGQWIDNGSSLISSEGYLDLPVIGRIGAGFKKGN